MKILCMYSLKDFCNVRRKSSKASYPQGGIQRTVFFLFNVVEFMVTLYHTYFLPASNKNKVEIKIGARQEANIEVLSGLNIGDIIVAEGLKKVYPRSKIKPIE